MAEDAAFWDCIVTSQYGHPITVRQLREAYLAECRRSAALMVDADRREKRAAEAAMDCAEHGKEIRYHRHMASWYWHEAQKSEDARQGIVRGLIVAARNLEGTGPIPAEIVARELLKAIDGQNQSMRRPRSPFADCAHSGECGHDGLSDDVKAEIAQALGLTAPDSGQGALFAAPARPGKRKNATATVAAHEGEG